MLLYSIGYAASLVLLLLQYYLFLSYPLSGMQALGSLVGISLFLTLKNSLKGISFHIYHFPYLPQGGCVEIAVGFMRSDYLQYVITGR